MAIDVTPQRGLLFRITHVANLPQLLKFGLHCSSRTVQNTAYVSIGNPDLIDKRSRWPVRIPPGGTLADYIPFYFTPKSPMLLNIKTGYNGINRRSNDEIAILVTTWVSLANHKVTVLFTDRHAYSATARWTAEPGALTDLLDWEILRRHDFSRSDQYPDKMERYQAEALAYGHVPADALLGVGCVSDRVKELIERDARKAGAALKVVVRPGWFF